jgi:hypothetical protein
VTLYEMLHFLADQGQSALTAQGKTNQDAGLLLYVFDDGSGAVVYSEKFYSDYTDGWRDEEEEIPLVRFSTEKILLDGLAGAVLIAKEKNERGNANETII